MSKKRCLRMESLPHHLVECIMERLPVKSLLRFKAVSNQWKSTVESPFFKERQLIHRQKSGDPDVFLVSYDPQCIESLRTLVLGSSSTVEIPTPWEMEDVAYFVCRSSLDGLVCLYDPTKSVFVINPTTRWYRALPLCKLQLLRTQLGVRYHKLRHRISKLGFGKDKFTGTYKAVWLYNSAEIGLENATTCEVFDFRSNGWSYVTPASPYRVAGITGPVYVDGSLYWFTECEETKVVSFDLHTQAFHVISKAPFANAKYHEMVMCNLDNRLCISLLKAPNQWIWSFNSGNKTWDKMCSIHLDLIPHSYNIRTGRPLLPLALLDAEKKKKKKRLLLCDRYNKRTLVTNELDTVFYHDAFSAERTGDPVCYFQSLISI